MTRRSPGLSAGRTPERGHPELQAGRYRDAAAPGLIDNLPGLVNLTSQISVGQGAKILKAILDNPPRLLAVPGEVVNLIHEPRHVRQLNASQGLDEFVTSHALISVIAG